MSESPIVIVGAGLAGAKTAEELRARGYTGGLVLIGAEPHRPYDRPPLSKEYLTGAAGLDKVFVHSKDWYSEHDVQLRVGQPVVAVDAGAHVVRLADGGELPYAKLLLATGSRPRRAPVPGGDAAGLLSLRSIEDADRIRETLHSAARMIIIGAGWIGLEVAAAARAAGVEVTVVESLQLPLLRVLGPEVAQSFADLHREHGVDLRLGASLAEITIRNGRPNGVRLDDGAELEADAVLVGVGIRPNTELATAAGLDVENGIVVDSALRSSDRDIYAAGDVASAYHPVLRTHIRVEHWANALNQPAVAAASMLGEQASFELLPFFYTDQYDLGMEYVGYVTPGGYDDVVIRGDLATREYIAFWRKDNRVLAGMNVNIWDVVDDVKALIESQVEIPAGRLADPQAPLRELSSP
jgi:3-phenylpropionate/trans-cinnamate dioxygenase ferredoxin reductase subunit